MVKVLVVEDEASIREMIALNLRLAGMEAVEADSAEAALPLLEQRPGCDAAILDVMLPGMNGFSLCETIRRTDQKIGIIILSAKGQEQDKIRGLSIGADDYMTKPFSVSELLARVEALCRRVGRSASTAAGEQAPVSLVSGSFVLDENKLVLTVRLASNSANAAGWTRLGMVASRQMQAKFGPDVTIADETYRLSRSLHRLN